MKISKIVFPLMMVTTMTSCIAGETPKAIDYDTFIATAQEEEAKESPYTKATVKYDIHENASSISSGGTGSFVYTLGEEGWVTDSEDEYAEIGSDILTLKASEMDDIVPELEADFSGIAERVAKPKSLKKKAGYFQTSSWYGLDAEIAITGGKMTIEDNECDVARLGLAYITNWINYGLLKTYTVHEYYLIRQNGEVVEDFDYEISCSVTYQK